MKHIYILFILLFNIAFADSITTFSSNKSTVNPGDTVNLNINYVATKKYELHFTAYDNNKNTEISPNFNAIDLKNIRYTIPKNAKYDIKIVAKLIEDGKEIDKKDIILNVKYTLDNIYFCSVYGTYGRPTYKNNGYLRNCFIPSPNVEYSLTYGDDTAIMIFSEKQKFKNGGSLFNTVALNTNSKIHYYNTNIKTLRSYSGYGCIHNCGSTFLGNTSYYQVFNSADTESRIIATYEPNNRRIKVVFKGGYYSCYCYKNNCCNEWRQEVGYIYLN